MAKPNESAPALSRTPPPSPRAEGVAEASEDFDDRMRRSLAERALGPVQAKPAIDAGYGDLIAAARAPLEPSTPAKADPGTVFDRAAFGAGQDVPFRADLERSLGAPLDGVRAFTGRSHDMAELGAQAAARGDQVVFADDSPSKELVAHEVVHVIPLAAPLY